MDTAGQVAYLSYLSGDGQRITLLHYDLRAERLGERSTVQSDTHRVRVTFGSLADGLSYYRQMLSKDMPLEDSTPRWTREMTLLEVLPSYFPGGFRGLTRKLPYYREIGFNTIYLMPHWVGGYSPIDPFAAEPSYGTAEDLREMVRVAHSLGMRVLFDMVIHGFGPKSPIVRQHPEFFQKDEHGLLVPHHVWGSMATHPASPAYQQYMVDLALHDIRTYGIDGYRVDANNFRMPNWDPTLPYPPWQSAAGTRQLLSRIYQAIRAVKPDAVLLSEIFGPVWHSICNLVHDNTAMGPQFILEKMEQREVTAAHYKAHLANELAALPKGANRVYFARNHDTSWFYRFNGYTPRFLAMDAIHILLGIPEVFAGEPKNKPNPDDDPAVFAYYRKLFRVRKELPELAAGATLLDEVECDNPWVFTGLRRLNARLVLVAISLSDREENASLALHMDRGAFPGARETQRPVILRMLDPVREEVVGVQNAGGASAGIMLTLKPFQVLVGRMQSPW